MIGISHIIHKFKLLVVMSIYVVAFSLFLTDIPAKVGIFLLVVNFVLVSLFWKTRGALIALSVSAGIFMAGLFDIIQTEYLIAGISLIVCVIIFLALILKQIEKEKKILSESENKYRQLSEQFKRYFDLVQVMIVGLDKDGNVILANKKTCETLGFGFNELQGKNWFRYFVANGIRENLHEYFEKLKELSNGALDYHENIIRSKDGTEKLIAWQNTVLKDQDGNVEAILAAGLDITQLRQTQDKLAKQLNLSKDLYFIAEKIVSEEPNIQKRAQILSKMCVELLGASLAWVGYAAPDKSVRIVDFYPPNHGYIQDLIIRWDDSVYAQGTVGRSIKTGRYHVIEDVLTDERFSAWKDKIAPYGLKTVLSFPLISPKGVFGVLVMYSDKYGFFNQEKIEQIRILSHLAAAALENARLFQELEKRFSRIEALYQIDKAISSSTDLKVILDIVLDKVIHQLGVHAADVLLFNEHSMTLEYIAGRGFKTKIVDLKPTKLGKSLAGKVGLDKEPIIINGDILEASERFSNPYFEEFKNFVQREGFVFYAAVPLVAKGTLLGVLEVFNRSQIEEDGEFIEFLQVLGQQTAIAVDTARLFEDLQKKNIELTDAYDATIEGWAYALDLRDKETEGHSERVTDLTLKIARKMGIKDEELMHIKRGALLHDIGKMGVPDHILLKPGKLTDEEWEIMKKHPFYAYQMLSRIEYLRPAIDIPYCHHERWNGTGYPRGLKGKQIPLSARIFAVVDVYDALTSDRPYRKAWSKGEAIEYIKNEKGKQFDPQVVDVFLTVLQEMEDRATL